MTAAFRTQARAVLSFYLEEVHALGAELSLAAELAQVFAAALAYRGERTADDKPPSL